MSVKVFVIVATFLGKSFGLPFDSNTSAIVRTELPDIHKPVTLGSTPYLPLLKFNDTVYYYGVILGGTAAQVELFCSYHNMQLVSIQTFEESQNLIAGLESFLQVTENMVFWTSGKKFGNSWRWESTGRPAHYTNWAKGEPNNSGGNETCIEVLFNSALKTLEWNDKNCEAVNYFICESRD
ncbi:unnamed protein product [Acanthoscelides obtectus]|uniref:C-type lectin domain-containing protein n=1 Tax=Acanthoscelides obtectus TaxID=200917 RepID=A0A9P0NWW2_ACAOB|nr:unnamed protein product [Acanthoscelides obtectus]CAK1668493.1 hypothetical protein AOBTE_LOCUS26436 [Acanthoscelides obtectus]